jgi:hypothetical protein
LPPPPEFIQLFGDLNWDQLRVRRPTRIIFFCGGATGEGARSTGSLRHYLLQDKQIGKKIDAEIILAEQANQLYRDTSYYDLITFEEDIARISAMVLLIAESPGSLAELEHFL